MNGDDTLERFPDLGRDRAVARRVLAYVGYPLLLGMLVVLSVAVLVSGLALGLKEELEDRRRGGCTHRR